MDNLFIELLKLIIEVVFSGVGIFLGIKRIPIIKEDFNMHYGWRMKLHDITTLIVDIVIAVSMLYAVFAITLPNLL